MAVFNEKTTDLDKVRDRPRLFTWGKVVKIHDVGRYTVVEYNQRKPNTEDLSWNVYFHVYLDGKDTNLAEKSLDGALLVALAVGHLGPNEGCSAARFLARMLKIEA